MIPNLKERLANIPRIEVREATFNQRRAIFNMRSALGMSLRGIADLSFDMASDEIALLKEQIERHGFPPQIEELDPMGRWWES